MYFTGPNLGWLCWRRGSCEEGSSVTGACILFEPRVPCVWNLKIQSLCKKKHTHKVVITMISAFPRASLPSALVLANVTNDYVCGAVEAWWHRVNSHCHHVVIGVKFPFCSPTVGTCLLRPFWIVSTLTLDLCAWESRYLKFLGVIEATFLMLYTIIFTAAFSSSGASYVAHMTAFIEIGGGGESNGSGLRYMLSCFR